MPSKSQTETARPNVSIIIALPENQPFLKREFDELDDESLFQKFASRGVIVKAGTDDDLGVAKWQINPALLRHIRDKDWFKRACE